ncbi:hypothetical protein [Sneathiella glossodoripedis]|uniref:hypothetical protein n=1 Tax=Sneathiella glossodoripedis TaxID=418853 RepID=UPI0011DE004F|nr:hypothetical protein [Sneathiella glossodoripedis]
MFSRNEKYGKALHLAYGFEANKPSPVQRKRPGFFKSLRSFFTSSDTTVQGTHSADQLELDLDKAFISQAVQKELRNTDAAANENGQALGRKDIA